MPRVIAGIVLGLALVFAAGVIVPRNGYGAKALEQTGPGREALLLSSAIHTDIALPADPDVIARFAHLGDDRFPIHDPNLRWLVFGWGGRAFYLETPTWADLKPLPVLRALTIDESVMHVALAGDMPRDHPTIRRLHLDTSAFEALLRHIEVSFEREGGGEAKAIEGAGYGDYDRFYPARGRFNALLGCNVWTAAALRQAGLRTGWWTPLPVLLDLSLRLHNR